jgi:hypothetical protein
MICIGIPCLWQSWNTFNETNEGSTIYLHQRKASKTDRSNIPWPISISGSSARSERLDRDFSMAARGGSEQARTTPPPRAGRSASTCQKELRWSRQVMCDCWRVRPTVGSVGRSVAIRWQIDWPPPTHVWNGMATIQLIFMAGSVISSLGIERWPEEKPPR